MGSQQFNFDNSYARDLEGFYVPWKGAEVPAPKMVRFNRALAEELRLDPSRSTVMQALRSLPATWRLRARFRWRWPMRAISSAGFQRSSAMAARCFWVR
jgi:uncharacterized protein YdiU (UPF0061 family)